MASVYPSRMLVQLSESEGLISAWQPIRAIHSKGVQADGVKTFAGLYSVHADPWSSGQCRLRTSMTRATIYVVQAFNAGKGKSLRADVPIPCRSAETARRTAERLAPAKAGVVAFSTAGDAELGDYDDEPTIIFKTGQLPAHFEDT